MFSSLSSSLALAAILASAADAADFGFAVPTNTPVFVLPSTEASVGFAWSTTRVYAAGAQVAVGGRTYMCALPGTSGTNAAVFGSSQVTDGTVVWLRSMAKMREGLALSLFSVGDIYLSFGDKASQGKGIWLPAGDGPYQISPDEPYQGRLSLFSTSTVTVAGTEW